MNKSYKTLESFIEYINDAVVLGGTCSNGWIAYAANNGCYYITPNNETYTWDEAQTYCSKTMAQDSTVPTTLLAVNNVNEMVNVFNIFFLIGTCMLYRLCYFSFNKEGIFIGIESVMWWLCR